MHSACETSRKSHAAEVATVGNAHQIAVDKSKHLRNVQELKHGIALSEYKPQGSPGTAQLATRMADDKSTYLRNAGLTTIKDSERASTIERCIGTQMSLLEGRAPR
jgi:hypothetical protein